MKFTNYATDLIDIKPLVQYDSNSQPYIEHTVNAGPWQESIDSRLQYVESVINELALEKAIRDSNPAAKDAYDKYQTVLGLVK